MTLEQSGRGVIWHPYSAHDFRHLYAVRLYQETSGVCAVKEVLGHSTVAVTEVYLAGLGALRRSP